MFKRVAKRQQKKALAEDLGLDEDDTKIFEEQETDSDESESDSDEDNSDIEFNDDGDGETDDEDTQSSFIMTMEQVRDNPIVLPTEASTMHTCLVCPGKIFRDPKGKEVPAHLESNTHMRRLKKISEIMSNLGTGPANIPKIVESLKEQKTNIEDPKALTNRAQKRMAKIQLLKEKRETRKEMKNKKIARKKLADEAKNVSAFEPVDAPANNESLIAGTAPSKEPRNEHEAPKPKKRKRSTDEKVQSDNNIKSSKDLQKKKKRKTDETVITASEPPNNKSKKKVSFKEPDIKSVHNNGNNKGSKFKKEGSIFRKVSTKRLVRYFDDKGNAKNRKPEIGAKGGGAGKGALDKSPLLRIFK